MLSNKKALITGVTGQIGSYLAEHLISLGYDVTGMIRRTSQVNARQRVDNIKGLKLVYGDLTDSASLAKVLAERQPDEIYNLGAQSHVWVSFETPESTFDIDALGALRLCEAARNHVKGPVKIYQASTSELYGGIYDFAVNEKTSFHPRSPYAVSKLAAFWTMVNFREAYNMRCSNGIVFNSESPRRGENFVTRKITLGLANIVKGDGSPIRLGNLDARRDWGHAKDTARAMHLILQAPKADDYVIATGNAHSIREFAEKAFNEAGISLKWRGSGVEEQGYDSKTQKTMITVDPLYFRPAEVNVLIGDSSKARDELGWKPEYTFDQLVKEMVHHDLEQFRR